MAHLELPRGAGRAAVAVVAHPDDESLWCGATLAALSRLEWRTVVLCCSSESFGACGAFSRLAELYAACRALGVTGVVCPLAVEERPSPLFGLLPMFDLVLCHPATAAHPAHERVFDLVRTAITSNQAWWVWDESPPSGRPVLDAAPAYEDLKRKERALTMHVSQFAYLRTLGAERPERFEVLNPLKEV